MRLTRLAARFLRIGAMGFGGPMALIGLMQSRLVEQEQAVSPDEFATGVAVGQILPGPVAVDCATHIGYRLRGFAGACVSTGALILPPFVLMLVLAPLYLRYGQIPQVGGFFKGVGPAIIAVIIMAGYNMVIKLRLNVAATAIAVLAAAGVICAVNPIILILLAGLAGMVAQGLRRRNPDVG